jgi:hypothetical protein
MEAVSVRLCLNISNYTLWHIHLESSMEEFYDKLSDYVRFEALTEVTMKNPSSYLTGRSLRLRYRAQAVNAM